MDMLMEQTKDKHSGVHIEGRNIIMYPLHRKNI